MSRGKSTEGLSALHRLFKSATGVSSRDKLRKIESFVRHEVYSRDSYLYGTDKFPRGYPAGVLDWQTRDELKQAARVAHATLVQLDWDYD